MKAVDEKVRAGVHELVDAILDAKTKGIDINLYLSSNFVSAFLFEGEECEIIDKTESIQLVSTKLFNTTIKRVKGWVENA